jgi:hypothetical protein
VQKVDRKAAEDEKAKLKSAYEVIEKGSK